ncbi:MAG: universal stress protein [Bdellovibrionota bacterium]
MKVAAKFLRKTNRFLIAADVNPIGQRLVHYVDRLFPDRAIAFRLAHVVQPHHIPKLATGYVGEFSGLDLSGVIEGDRYREAVKLLDEQSRDIVIHREVETIVLEGRPSAEIAQDAFSSGVELAIVAPGAKGNFIPYGYSTTINLMAQSKVPVMAIPQPAFKKELPERPCFLIADNLEDVSKGALAFTHHVASRFSNSKIVHIHVAKGSKDEILKFGDLLQEKMNLGIVPHKDNFSPQSFYNSVEDGVQKILRGRMEAISNLDNENYECAALFGKVSEQLAYAIEKWQPDFLVFGRHELMHMKPFSIGKMPFHGMLSYEIPIFLVPKAIYS